MRLTEAEAKAKFCPTQYTAEQGGVPCGASGCMAWRWADAITPDPQIETIWPGIEDENILRAGEPPRPDDLRNEFVWKPLIGSDDDLEGGYWREPQSAYAARVAAHRARRRGFCGAFGKPEAEQRL